MDYLQAAEATTTPELAGDRIVDKHLDDESAQVPLEFVADANSERLITSKGDAIETIGLDENRAEASRLAAEEAEDQREYELMLANSVQIAYGDGPNAVSYKNVGAGMTIAFNDDGKANTLTNDKTDEVISIPPYNGELITGPKQNWDNNIAEELGRRALLGEEYYEGYDLNFEETMRNHPELETVEVAAAALAGAHAQRAARRTS